MRILSIIFLLSFTTAAIANSTSTYYSCSPQGSGNSSFPDKIKLEISPDKDSLTFYASEGENCNGSINPNYKPKTHQNYSQFSTDCEWDGFVEVLVSQALLNEDSRGSVILRTRGETFSQAGYFCKLGN